MSSILKMKLVASALADGHPVLSTAFYVGSLSLGSLDLGFFFDRPSLVIQFGCGRSLISLFHRLKINFE